MKKKLFSKPQKDELAALKINYLHNKSRVGSGAGYSLKAAGFAKQILTLFISVVATVEDDADINEFCERINDNLHENPVFTAKTYEGRLAQLQLWLSTRHKQVTDDLGRLKRKTKPKP